MSIESAIKKYIEATTRSNVFARYEKEFARKIVSALSEGYHHELFEPKLVQIIEGVVNSVSDLIIRDHRGYLELSTRAIFIHGNKSQVEFDYYGRRTQRELGDLIFIVSLIFNGRKYFEKFTINQVKRDSPKSGKEVYWNVRSNISSKEQLYLLSRFPTFRGTGSSIIPMTEYALPNYSGCLGSYGLLCKPGDFIFISATELDSLIGRRSTLKVGELSYLKTVESPWLHLPWFYPNIDEVFYLMHKFYRYSGSTWYFLWSLFSNHHHAYNAFDFAHKYLTLGIGEPVFMKVGIDNVRARNFLHEVLSAVRIKAEREGLLELSSFVDEFFRYGYSDNEEQRGPVEGIEFGFEGGGIGIIHTTINLGE